MLEPSPAHDGLGYGAHETVGAQVLGRNAEPGVSIV